VSTLMGSKGLEARSVGKQMKVGNVTNSVEVLVAGFAFLLLDSRAFELLHLIIVEDGTDVGVLPFVG
jgi:hypothetical protein